MPLCTKLTVFFSDDSGERHPQPDAGQPGEECESADLGLKGATDPSPSPDRDAAVGTPAASGVGDNLATIVSTPLASAEHVSFLFYLLCCRGAQALSMGVAPESIDRKSVV